MSRWLDRALAVITEREGTDGSVTDVETVVIVETPASSPEEPVSTVSTVSTEAARGNWEERAAIVQEGANVPPGWAEGFAALEGRPVPPGIDSKAWVAMLDAAGRFLDQWGSKAAALGWTAGDLFSLDPQSPINRRDRRGAAFFLVGAEVLAITADDITMRMAGSIQRFRRRTGSMVSLWDDG